MSVRRHIWDDGKHFRKRNGFLAEPSTGGAELGSEDLFSGRNPVITDDTEPVNKTARWITAKPVSVCVWIRSLTFRHRDNQRFPDDPPRMVSYTRRICG